MVEAERGVSRIDLPKPNTDSTSWPGKLPSEPLTSIFSISASETVSSVSCATASDDADNAKPMVKARASGFNLNVVLIMFSSLFLLTLEQVFMHGIIKVCMSLLSTISASFLSNWSISEVFVSY